MHDDPERCYLAVQSKDPRFDGWFVTAVTSTGIYCRPSCPARTPQRRNVRFLPTAAAAQRAGFRACKRCRPDATPGSPEWDGRADVVARAMRLIADGVIDRAGVPGLADQVGYSVRQLERVLLAEVGAGPVALARAQRAQTARVLVETTDLSMTEVAFAAGFTSIRQFNDTVRAVFAAPPSALRATGPGPVRGARAAPGRLDLRLPFRQPLCPDTLFGHLAATAVPGVEEVVGTTYRRTLRLPHGPGIVALTPTASHIACRMELADVADLTAAIARCRRLLDLDADPDAVDRALSVDPVLGPAVGRSPGRRVPRTVDGDEFAVRAVLGQQVSTAAARTCAGALVAERGEPLATPSAGLTHLFPRPGSWSARHRHWRVGGPGRWATWSRPCTSGGWTSGRGPTGTTPARCSAPCPGSDRGRWRWWRCGRSVTRTPFRWATSACAPGRPGSGCPVTPGRCSAGPSGGVRGAPMRPSTCGRPPTTR